MKKGNPVNKMKKLFIALSGTTLLLFFAIIFYVNTFWPQENFMKVLSQNISRQSAWTFSAKKIDINLFQGIQLKNLSFEKKHSLFFSHFDAESLTIGCYDFFFFLFYHKKPLLKLLKVEGSFVSQNKESSKKTSDSTQIASPHSQKHSFSQEKQEKNVFFETFHFLCKQINREISIMLNKILSHCLFNLTNFQCEIEKATVLLDIKTPQAFSFIHKPSFRKKYLNAFGILIFDQKKKKLILELETQKNREVEASFHLNQTAGLNKYSQLRYQDSLCQITSKIIEQDDNILIKHLDGKYKNILFYIRGMLNNHTRHCDVSCVINCNIKELSFLKPDFLKMPQIKGDIGLFISSQTPLDNLKKTLLRGVLSSLSLQIAPNTFVDDLSIDFQYHEDLFIIDSFNLTFHHTPFKGNALIDFMLDTKMLELQLSSSQIGLASINHLLRSYTERNSVLSPLRPFEAKGKFLVHIPLKTPENYLFQGEMFGQNLYFDKKFFKKNSLLTTTHDDFFYDENNFAFNVHGNQKVLFVDHVKISNKNLEILSNGRVSKNNTVLFCSDKQMTKTKEHFFFDIYGNLSEKQWTYQPITI